MDLETVVLRFCNFSFGKFKFMYPKCIRGVTLLLVYCGQCYIGWETRELGETMKMIPIPNRTMVFVDSPPVE